MEQSEHHKVPEPVKKLRGCQGVIYKNQSVLGGYLLIFKGWILIYLPLVTLPNTFRLQQLKIHFLVSN